MKRKARVVTLVTATLLALPGAAAGAPKEKAPWWFAYEGSRCYTATLAPDPGGAAFDPEGVEVEPGTLDPSNPQEAVPIVYTGLTVPLYDESEITTSPNECSNTLDATTTGSLSLSTAWTAATTALGTSGRTSDWQYVVLPVRVGRRERSVTVSTELTVTKDMTAARMYPGYSRVDGSIHMSIPGCSGDDCFVSAFSAIADTAALTPTPATLAKDSKVPLSVTLLPAEGELHLPSGTSYVYVGLNAQAGGERIAGATGSVVGDMLAAPLTVTRL